MKDRRTVKFESVLGRVNALLCAEWAPIGFAGALPQDEYERYAVRVVSMLSEGAAQADIAGYLTRVGTPLAGEDISVRSAAVAGSLERFREEARAIAF